MNANENFLSGAPIHPPLCGGHGWQERPGRRFSAHGLDTTISTMGPMGMRPSTIWKPYSLSLSVTNVNPFINPGWSTAQEFIIVHQCHPAARNWNSGPASNAWEHGISNGVLWLGCKHATECIKNALRKDIWEILGRKFGVHHVGVLNFTPYQNIATENDDE